MNSLPWMLCQQLHGGVVVDPDRFPRPAGSAGLSASQREPDRLAGMVTCQPVTAQTASEIAPFSARVAFGHFASCALVIALRCANVNSSTLSDSTRATFRRVNDKTYAGILDESTRELRRPAADRYDGRPCVRAVSRQSHPAALAQW